MEDVEAEVTASGPKAPDEQSANESSKVHLSSTRFADLVSTGIICASSGRALKEVVKHEFLTLVQDATIAHILEGLDCLAQAKTGTGKTLGFLIPAIERLYRNTTSGTRLPHSNAVSILVISPTRELAQQIAVEAEQLLTFLPFKVQVVIGGTNMNAETKRLANPNQRCDLLIATPGRLLDHFENSGLKAACSNLQVLIFDEADRLLEEGFKREIDKIIGFLPPTQRQTLLFSATIPPSVHEVAQKALRPGFKFITTIAEYESSTHDHVPQHHLIVPMPEMLVTTVALLRHILQTTSASSPSAQTPPKIILFFPTARATQLFAELLLALQPPLPLPIFEIHSRKSQSARTKATDAFRAAQKGAIMVSSDVSARGMDFPGVTHVLQIGAPSSREQYIHRLGRTARAGSAGTGVLVLGQFEAFFLRRALQGVDVMPFKVDLGVAQQMEPVRAALGRVSGETKGMAYAAWLGFYNALTREIGWRGKDELVREGNRYALECLGCETLPGIPKKTVGKMGLKGVPGLNLVDDVRKDASGGGRGGRGGHGGRGGRGGNEGGGGAARIDDESGNSNQNGQRPPSGGSFAFAPQGVYMGGNIGGGRGGQGGRGRGGSGRGRGPPNGAGRGGSQNNGGF
ncbi:P-loop containing nucleoside triphosphate hydrolase protein [Chytriomyces sp. MP71]|nr:P-loop containing nucleoside triphosphate hydrolase protein [Chytriomyces sp. MP71]